MVELAFGQPRQQLGKAGGLPSVVYRSDTEHTAAVATGPASGTISWNLKVVAIMVIPEAS